MDNLERKALEEIRALEHAVSEASNQETLSLQKCARADATYFLSLIQYGMQRKEALELTISHKWMLIQAMKKEK